MRGLFNAASFWLGVVLGALTIVNLIARGLSVTLNGYPQVLYAWYKLVFHGLFDLLFYPLALAIHGGLTWIDELAGTDFRETMLVRFSKFVVGKLPLGQWIESRVAVTAVGSAMVLFAWPVLVIILYWEWTRDAEHARSLSEGYFFSIQREPKDAYEYEKSLRALELAADHDSIMYMAYMERNAFILALSLSANFTILAAIAIFTWSAISIQPP